MLEESSLLFVNSASAGAGTAASLENGGGGEGEPVSGRYVGEQGLGGEIGDRNLAGNRWLREETLALLKIRSEMEVAFREPTLKAPLWDEVSRKLSEHGYHRSAKKCREKFENIHKYHKRTKQGLSNRQNRKNYRFFEQLEVLHNNDNSRPPSTNKIETTLMPEKTIEKSRPIQNLSEKEVEEEEEETMSTSTSTTSDENNANKKKNKKRKLKDFFQKLTKQVLQKQEILQKHFIERIEKYDNDRIAREEQWKNQETARIKKEQDALARERAIAAEKDAAVISFFQKISNQTIPNHPFLENSSPTTHQQAGCSSSSSRWPNAEVEALIMVKTDFDSKFYSNGHKGHLWEEISMAMKKLGYDRSAKRCKEKWENINKYFRRVRESDKRRRRRRDSDSKTCGYFRLLESLYEKKCSGIKIVDGDGNGENVEQKQEDNEEEDDDEDDGDDDNNVGVYEIVSCNNPTSLSSME